MKLRRKIMALVMAAMMLLSMLPTATAMNFWCPDEGLEHDWGPAEYYETICGTNWGSRYCRRCGCGEEVTKWVDHSWTNWNVTRTATCEEPGVRERHCTRCGQGEEEEYYADHQLGPWIQDPSYDPPTCTEGSIYIRVCRVCGATWDETEVDPLGHAWGDWKIIGEASCQKKATERRTCTRCGDTETIRSNYGPHSWGAWYVTKQGSCTSPGTEERKCSVCGATENRTSEADGHSFGSWVTETQANCQQKGSTSRTCKNCGYKETKSSDYGDHSWGGWKTIEKGDCTHPGIEERSCSVCGKTQQRESEDGGHTWQSWSTLEDASCTEDGVRERKCSACGKTVSEALAALGHSWGEWTIIQEATPFSMGIRERKCSRCGLTERENFYPDGTLINGDRGDAVEDLQGELNNQGYDCGTADGIFGNNTEEAWKDWQEDHGYDSDGIAWPGQQDELFGNEPEGDEGAEDDEGVEDEEGAENTEGEPGFTTSIRLERIDDTISIISSYVGEYVHLTLKVTNTGDNTVWLDDDLEVLNRLGQTPDKVYDASWSCLDGSGNSVHWLEPGGTLVSRFPIFVDQHDLDAGEIKRTFIQYAEPYYFTDENGEMIPSTGENVNEKFADAEWKRVSAEGVRATLDVVIPLEDYPTTATLEQTSFPVVEECEPGDIIPVDMKLTNTGATYVEPMFGVYNSKDSFLRDEVGSLDWYRSNGDKPQYDMMAPGESISGTMSIRVYKEDIEAGVITRKVAATVYPVSYWIDSTSTRHYVGIHPAPAGWEGDYGIASGSSARRYTVWLEIIIPIGDGQGVGSEYDTSLKLEVLTDLTEVTGKLGDVIPVELLATNTGETFLGMSEGKGYYRDDEAAEWDIVHPFKAYTMGSLDWRLYPGKQIYREYDITVTEKDVAAGEIVRVFYQKYNEWHHEDGEAVTPENDDRGGLRRTYPVELPASVEIRIPLVTDGYDEDSGYTTAIDVEVVSDLSGTSAKPGDVVPVELSMENIGETVVTMWGHAVHYGDGEYAAGDKCGAFFYDPGVNPARFKPGERAGKIYNIVVTDEDVAAGEIVRTYVQYASAFYYADGQVMRPDDMRDEVARVDSDHPVTDTVEIRIPLSDGIATEASVVLLKEVVSEPANWEYYQQGEIVTYQLTLLNNSAETINGITVYDPMASDDDGGLGAVLGRADLLGSGGSVIYEFSHTVTAEDVEAGAVHNYGVATWYRPGSGSMQTSSSDIKTIYTSENGGGSFENVGFVKTVESAPANGSYYVLGETVNFGLYIENRMDAAISDVEIMDPLKGSAEDACVGLGIQVDAGSVYMVNVFYTITEADVERGFVINQAEMTFYDPEGDAYVTIPSNAVVVSTSETSSPLKLEKVEVSTPANGSYYIPGEYVYYEVTLANTGDETFYDVIVYDPILEFAEVATYDVVAPGFCETVDFSYQVTADDAEATSVSNTAFIIRPNGADFSDRIYSNTVTVACGYNYFDFGGFETTVSCLELNKTVLTAPANGMFYTPGEIVTFMIGVTNNHPFMDMQSVTVVDVMMEENGSVWSCDRLARGESLYFTFDYVVTPMDAIAGIVTNVASGVAYGAEGTRFAATSESVEVPTGMTDAPFGVITGMTIVKEVTNTPKNGAYYTEGETIEYRITYTNTGETPFGETVIYDPLKADDPEIAYAETLSVGESRFCTFSYVVTAEDVAKGYVANVAIAKFDVGGYIGTATSEPAVSDTDGDANTTYVPGSGTIDWSEIRGESGSTDANGNAIPAEVTDTCYVKVVARNADSVEYEVHFCSEHARTHAAILKMADTMEDDGNMQAVWDYASVLWQKDLNKMYEELLGACDENAKITVMNERVTGLAMVANTQFALKVAMPSQPEEVSHAVAELWQNKCVDLCYLMNTAPSERVDSIFDVLRTDDYSAIAEVCVSEITGEEIEKTLCVDTYCVAHSFTYEMMEILLLAEQSESSWDAVRTLWELELNHAYNELYKNASEEGGAAYLAEYAAYLKELAAQEEFLKMVYPENGMTVAEVLVNSIVTRTMDVCGRMK